MKEVNIMNKKCLGCGVIMQSTSPDEPGYIPANKLEDSDYCQRCFRLIHYAKKVINKPNLDNKELLKVVNESNSCVFFLVDLFNINNEIINTFKSINRPKVLLINKSDLIPSGVKLFYLKDNIKTVYDIASDIVFISTKKDISKYLFTDFMQKNNTDSAYMLGYTNAGKSSLINKLSSSKITTSNMPNTTIDLITLKLDNYTIIDTPGFTLNKTFYQDNDWELIKRINASHTVKPITYQTKDNQIFLIEEKIFFREFGENSITFYLSNLIKLKKIYKENTMKYIEINIPNNSDIVITNIGFINIKKECHIKINEEALNLIEVRPPNIEGRTSIRFNASSFIFM